MSAKERTFGFKINYSDGAWGGILESKAAMVVN